MKIAIDTRETRPLQFRVSKHVEGCEIKKLDVGDYSICGFEDKIAIERKSANDLYGTLGKGHDRFKQELIRANSYEFFAIVVESPFNVILEKEYEGSHFSKMKGHTVVNTCMTYIVRDKIPVFFCNGRNEAVSLIRNLFKAYMRMKEDEETKFRRLAKKAKKKARRKGA